MEQGPFGSEGTPSRPRPPQTRAWPWPIRAPPPLRQRTADVRHVRVRRPEPSANEGFRVPDGLGEPTGFPPTSDPVVPGPCEEG